MRISSIRIKNFRALVDVEIPLACSTVIIGENNCGKSSVLDCISLALGRRWGQRGTGFSDYDVTIADDVQSSAGTETAAVIEEDDSEPAEPPDDETEEKHEEASVELHFAEQNLNEWPEEITQGLFGIIQTDPISGLNSITLRVSYRFNALEKSYEPGWAFIDVNGDPIGASEAKRAANTSQFFKYVPVFVLSALRDASEEFSSRSQFWGRLLKAVEISPGERRALDEAIEELNAKLLAADPRIAETVERLKEIQSVVAHGAAKDVSIRALPMKVWELLARSEIVLKGEEGAPWLPLDRHGQGVKSLSVIYLFNAFVERLLREVYSLHSEPIVALEEPEVHLHPQAVRALWSQITAMPGQKIVASHSPYFVQFVPIKDVRLLRRHPGGVRAYYVPDKITVPLPPNADIAAFAAGRADRFVYDTQRGVLAATGPVDEDAYREILRCYTAPEDRIHHAAIRDFRDRSYALLEQEDLEVLEDWARRIRGEIFFSRFWILCEGQSEVFLLTALFDALDFNLDTHSISLIDYQNNGNPRAFAALARTFGFPWFLLSDGDNQGRNTLVSLENAGFSAEELNAKVVTLPNGQDLEAYICQSALRSAAHAVAKEIKPEIDDSISDDGLAAILRAHKPIWARRAGEKIRSSPPNAEDLPVAFARIRKAILEYGGGDDAAVNT
ncbi:MAG: ATP-dependent nuclease [Pseudomonadota bacterium]